MLGLALFLFIGWLMFKKEGGADPVLCRHSSHRATSHPNMTLDCCCWRYSWHHSDELVFDEIKHAGLLESPFTGGNVSVMKIYSTVKSLGWIDWVIYSIWVEIFLVNMFLLLCKILLWTFLINLRCLSLLGGWMVDHTCHHRAYWSNK